MKELPVAIALMLSCGLAHAYIWSSAVPTEVHLVDGGLLLIGNFNNEGVTCANGPRGVFLAASDVQFDRKLAMAMLAYTSGKPIQVLIADPIATNCQSVSAVGQIPIAYHNYWQLK